MNMMNVILLRQMIVRIILIMNVLSLSNSTPAQVLLGLPGSKSCQGADPMHHHSTSPSVSRMHPRKENTYINCTCTSFYMHA